MSRHARDYASLGELMDDYTDHLGRTASSEGKMAARHVNAVLATLGQASTVADGMELTLRAIKQMREKTKGSIAMPKNEEYRHSTRPCPWGVR